MKVVNTIIILMLMILFVGCGSQSTDLEESGADTLNYNETQPMTEYVTAQQTKASLIPFQFGEVQNYESMAAIFSDKDDQYSDGQAIYKNSYASAEVKSIPDSESSMMHSVSYNSTLGSVKDIKVYIDAGTDNIPDMNEFYEADMNDDGYKDLIYTYLTEGGTGYSRGIYVYDFKNKKEIPVVVDNKYGDKCFTKVQEKRILEELRGWLTKDADVLYLNEDDFFRLHTYVFAPQPVVYNGEMAVHVDFAPFMAYSWIDTCRHEAILMYRNGEYVVDKVWSTGEWWK